MKQLKLFSALLMCLFALSLTACGGGDDDDNDGGAGNGDNGGGTTTQFEKADLYGGWKYDSGDECSIFYFSDDESNGLFIENADSKNYDRCEIIYNVSSDVTSLTIIEEDGDKVKYTIHQLNSEKLVLEDDEEEIYTLKRYTGNIDEEYPVKVAPTHEAVDLGLSVKWATCNVGATFPEEYGDYFAWGATSPKDTYTNGNCKTDGKNIGDISGNPAYDAATANWGDDWRMPTRVEMQELIDDCTWQWTWQVGNVGYKVIGPNGNSIFLPAAGYRVHSYHNRGGEYGDYLSSTPNSSEQRYAYTLFLKSDDYYLYSNDRYCGSSVRPVTE